MTPTCVCITRVVVRGLCSAYLVSPYCLLNENIYSQGQQDCLSLPHGQNTSILRLYGVTTLVDCLDVDYMLPNDSLRQGDLETIGIILKIVFTRTLLSARWSPDT